MTKFVDLLKNDLWTEADIVNRTESLLRSEFSVTAERILNRKVQGATLGRYTLTDQEMLELESFANISNIVRITGDEARADMVILGNVRSLEAAYKRLALALTEPVESPANEETGELAVVINQDEIDTDTAERTVVQAVVNSASTDLLALHLLRNPPAPEPEVEPVTEGASA